MPFNTNNSVPSIDPALLNSLPGAFKSILDKHTQGTDGMIPAKVVSFDRAKNRVTVQPVISVVSKNGQIIRRAKIPNIPVMQIGGGGMLLNFNLLPGDTGWLFAGDRDPSNYLKSNEVSPPNTYEMKKYGFGVFIPGCITGFNIAPADANNTVLQTKDGQIKITIGSSGVVIDAPSVKINTTGNTEIKADGDVKLEATQNLNIKAGINSLIEIDGAATVNAGTLTAMVQGVATVNAASLIATVPGACSLTTPVLHVSGNITASGSITPGIPP
jgi:hypothetical protein